MAKLEKPFDFDIMSSYEEFAELEPTSLYQWGSDKWTGETKDGHLIAVSTSNGALQLAKGETYDGLKYAKFYLVGILKDKKSVISASSALSTKEICEFMSWEVDYDYVMDFLK